MITDLWFPADDSEGRNANPCGCMLSRSASADTGEPGYRLEFCEQHQRGYELAAQGGQHEPR